MKIAIDISQIVYGTGVSVYTKELVRSLLKVDSYNEYILYAGVLKRKSDINDFVSTLHGDFSVVTIPLPPRASHYFWNYMRILSIESFVGHIDILHTSDWTEPQTRAKKVTTVHDLSPLLYPQVTPSLIKNVFKRKIYLVEKDQNAVISPSLTIAEELLKYGIESKKIHTISEAPNPELLSAPNINVYRRFNIPKKYILMVGTAQRKNIDRAVEAFSKANIPECDLVIVGESSAAHTHPNVRYLGFVSTHELANLYKNALLFLYPSLYEGFGLPILEGFALGCPVVTSNIGAMEEVSQGAAIEINPYDTRDITKGIFKALTNRKSLIQKGKKRASKFSWDNTAEETLKVYNLVYEGK